MLLVGYPAGAILATCGQPPGYLGVPHGNKALVAVGVGTLGDELYRAGAVQTDDPEEREGVVVELQSEPYRFLCFKTDYLIRNAYAD